jgi:hypothetical protein
MRDHLGEEWENFSAAHEQQSPVSIRVNPKKDYKIDYQNKIPGPQQGITWTNGLPSRWIPSCTQEDITCKNQAQCLLSRPFFKQQTIKLI